MPTFWKICLNEIQSLGTPVTQKVVKNNLSDRVKNENLSNLKFKFTAHTPFNNIKYWNGLWMFKNDQNHELDFEMKGHPNQ